MSKNTVLYPLVLILAMIVRIIVILIVLINFDRISEVVLLVNNHLVVTIVGEYILQNLVHNFGVALAYWNHLRSWIKHLLLLSYQILLVELCQIVISMALLLCC